MALVAHKYMPEQMPVEELCATFTAREHTLDFLVKALRDQIGARTLTSYLITGPRGSGKTTLVLMLCLRLREDPELAANWLPVRFPEELPAITSLRDLFAAALSVLAEDGIEGAREWHEKVERQPDERRSRDLAVTALRRIAEERGRRLILFVENFDQLFDRAWAKEEATLRRLLMADPFMLIVGTTVRQFEALRAYGRAFFNYFCEVPLKRLDDEQVKALLVSRAAWDDRPDIADRYRAYEADIRAICRLTGGNARLTVMLYEILSHGDIKSVVGTLRQLVDQLTPLLKDVLEHQLTDQQRKVVDALMRAGGTATPRGLASATRLSLNTVTTQLQRLKEAEVVDVQGGGKGRPAYYFVPDQLFCTWYQMRYLHPRRRRIEMFLDVLRTWFKAEERWELVKSVVAVGKPGAYGLAFECFEEVGRIAIDPRVKSSVLVNRGIARGKQGDLRGAIRDLSAVVDRAGVASELQAVALMNRAQVYVSLGQSGRSFEDAMTVAGNAVCTAPMRMWAFVAAARASPSDQHRVERVCSEAKAFVTSLAPEEQRKRIVELLSGLSSPGTALVWLRFWRTVGRDHPQDVLSSLAFLDAVAEVLEGHERSVLKPLPPEQREFAEEILRKLQPPTDAKPATGATDWQ